LISLKDLEQIYGALETEVSSLIASKLKAELKKAELERSWISDETVTLKNGKVMSIRKLVKDMAAFRNKLTALRVAISFIPTISIEFTWADSYKSLMTELAEVLETIKKKGNNAELFDTLEKLRDSKNTKITIQATCKYPTDT
jgi:hypothetical protein